MSLARKPQSLKDERARLFSEAEGLLDQLDAESRDFTKVEEQRYNGILAKIESTTKLIALQGMEGSTGQPGDNELFTPIGGPAPSSARSIIAGAGVNAWLEA